MTRAEQKMRELIGTKDKFSKGEVRDLLVEFSKWELHQFEDSVSEVLSSTGMFDDWREFSRFTCRLHAKFCKKTGISLTFKYLKQ